jgi:hypothetical protein
LPYATNLGRETRDRVIDLDCHGLDRGHRVAVTEREDIRGLLGDALCPIAYVPQGPAGRCPTSGESGRGANYLASIGYRSFDLGEPDAMLLGIEPPAPCPGEVCGRCKALSDIPALGIAKAVAELGHECLSFNELAAEIPGCPAGDWIGESVE